VTNGGPAWTLRQARVDAGTTVPAARTHVQQIVDAQTHAFPDNVRNLRPVETPPELPPGRRLITGGRMHATIRLYLGMAGQSGRFAAHRVELQKLMGSVPGLLTFHLIETAEGVATVTVCHDRAASDEAASRLLRWTDDRVPDLAHREPLIVGGEVITAMDAVHPSPARAVTDAGEPGRS
jgi:hypothetical protein